MKNSKTDKAMIAAAVLFGIAAIFASSCKDDWEAAEESAQAFAHKVPGSTGDVECAKKDSDGDGYCSCTVFMKEAPHTSVECGCEKYCINCAEGCKIVDTVKLRGDRRR